MSLRALAGLLVLLVASACSLQTSPSATSAARPSPSPLSVNSASGTLQDQFIAVVSKVSPAVVVIETSQGLGSGIVYDTSGDIVTNAHVVGSSTSFKVLLSTGKSYDGNLVGVFARDDLAVIKITAPDLQPAAFGDSNTLRVGEIVLAIGNPLGLQSSVTEGIISALGRSVVEPGGNALPPVIQTSAAINPGNSGGALVNLRAEVVGIPTLAAQDPQMGGAAPGIGFAIPSDVAKDIADQLIKSGKVTNTHRAYLGVASASLSSGKGVLVYSVVAGGPADKAGIKANDIISAVDGKPTPDPTALAQVLAALNPGQTVKVTLIRADGSMPSVDLTLGELPA